MHENLKIKKKIFNEFSNCLLVKAADVVAYIISAKEEFDKECNCFPIRNFP